MTSSALTYPLRARRHFALLASIVGVFLLAILTVFVLSIGGISWNFFFFLLSCAVFLVLLCVARPLSGKALAGDRQSVLCGTLVIWLFLMVSEPLFTHNQTTQSAAKGNVGNNAVYQATSWILCFCALAFISWFRPGHLRRLFAGPMKWASMFAVVTVLSSPLSRQPLYSAALAFKMCVIVVTLCAIGGAMTDTAGVRLLFRTLFWGMLISVSLEFTAPFFRSAPVFQGDRLGFMIGLSGTCGLLLLLSILFLCLTKSSWFLACGLYSFVVMMLAATKGGIVASFVSLMMFFLMLKRPAQALAVSFVFTVIFFLCVAFTPLGKSLEKYTESGNSSTLTGRTNLWSATWPVIESHPVLGKGYRSSRFLSKEVPGSFA